MRVFQAMRTQWRMGFNAPIGLDYGVLPAVMKQMAVRKKERSRVFSALRVMEREALLELHE